MVVEGESVSVPTVSWRNGGLREAGKRCRVLPNRAVSAEPLEGVEVIGFG